MASIGSRLGAARVRSADDPLVALHAALAPFGLINPDAPLPTNAEDRDACGYIGVTMAQGVAYGSSGDGTRPNRAVAAALERWASAYPDEYARWAPMAEEPW